MTVLTIGPVTQDKIIKGKKKYFGVGGPTYFQSFVFDSLNIDYKAIVNLSNLDLLKEFPDLSKIIPIVKSDTHLFTNHYPYPDNLDVRKQYSNFADIPISKKDLQKVLKDGENIEGIIINPLNRFDFPLKTINYLKTFDIPLYLSIQGFIRVCDENSSVKLSFNNQLYDILDSVEGLFLDEKEAEIVFNGDFSKFDVNEIIITKGSKGSRIIKNNKTIPIKAVENNNVLDSTGCGDTYMAAYISKKLDYHSPEVCGKFASLIASKKLSINGPYRI